MNSLQNITKPLFLQFLKEINKTNIPYFAAGGTMLGAIRHKGIIPWDTDVDIGILLPKLKMFFTWLCSTDYFLWTIPSKKSVKGIFKNYNDFYQDPRFKQCYNNRIKTYNELINKLNTQVYITSKKNIEGQDIGMNSTCCELEIFQFTKNLPINSYWNKILPRKFKSYGFYIYKNGHLKKSLKSVLKGREIIPRIYMMSLIKVPFYDTHINISKHSIFICELFI